MALADSRRPGRRWAVAVREALRPRIGVVCIGARVAVAAACVWDDWPRHRRAWRAAGGARLAARLTAFTLLAGGLAGCGLVSNADEKFLFAETRPPFELESQYIALANELHSVKPCYLIAPDSLRVLPFNAIGSQVTLARSVCFSVVAGSAGDERWCAKVRSASTLLFSGADLNAENCRRVARVTGTVSLEFDVPGIIRLAGYEPDEVDAFLVEQGRFSSIDAATRYRRDSPSIYWNEVRMTLLHTADFFARIEQLPAYGDSGDLAAAAALEWQARQQRPWVPPEQRARSAPSIGAAGPQAP